MFVFKVYTDYRFLLCLPLDTMNSHIGTNGSGLLMYHPIPVVHNLFIAEDNHLVYYVRPNGLP